MKRRNCADVLVDQLNVHVGQSGKNEVKLSKTDSG